MIGFVETDVGRVRCCWRGRSLGGRGDRRVGEGEGSERRMR